jgi:hypothetical protein
MPTFSKRDIDDALDELRVLVQSDGADFRFTGIDQSGTISLDLVLDGVDCMECVMQRDFLEEVSLNVIRRHVDAVSRVSISDPRIGA